MIEIKKMGYQFGSLHHHQHPKTFFGTARAAFYGKAGQNAIPLETPSLFLVLESCFLRAKKNEFSTLRRRNQGTNGYGLDTDWTCSLVELPLRCIRFLQLMRVHANTFPRS